MESKKYNKLVNKTKKKQTLRHREQTSGYQWGEGMGAQYRSRIFFLEGLLWDYMKSCVSNL